MSDLTYSNIQFLVLKRFSEIYTDCEYKGTSTKADPAV